MSAFVLVGWWAVHLGPFPSPSVRDLPRFPPLEVAEVSADLAWARWRELDKLSWYFPSEPCWRRYAREQERIASAWGKLRSAHYYCDPGYASYGDYFMKCLRDHIGAVDYAAGRMPCPVPACYPVED